VPERAEADRPRQHDRARIRRLYRTTQSLERRQRAETGYSDMERLKYAAATLSHDDRQVARPFAG
jgi:hypothetical protein